MLNSDFELVFDIQLDGDSKALCQIDTNCFENGYCGKHGICPSVDTYKLAKSYAEVTQLPVCSNIRALISLICIGKTLAIRKLFNNTYIKRRL